jgi:hypothetical protein
LVEFFELGRRSALCAGERVSRQNPFEFRHEFLGVVGQFGGQAGASFLMTCEGKLALVLG